MRRTVTARLIIFFRYFYLLPLCVLLCVCCSPARSLLMQGHQRFYVPGFVAFFVSTN